MAFVRLDIDPTALRLAFVARLQLLGIADGQIYDSRSADFGPEDGAAAVNVFSAGGRSARDSLNGAVYTRTQQIMISAFVAPDLSEYTQAAADAVLGAAIDTLEAEITGAVLRWQQLRCSVDAVTAIESVKGTPKAADRPQGLLRMGFEIETSEIYDASDDPTVDVDDLDSVYLSTYSGEEAAKPFAVLVDTTGEDP